MDMDMDMDMDIVGFVTAQLDEEQAGAEAARDAHIGLYATEGDAEWRVAEGGEGVWTEQHGINVVVDGHGYLRDAVAEHIARHDPARVLAEVAAKRRVLERHRRPRSPAEIPTGVDSRCCVGCGFLGDTGIPPRTPDINDCPELRDLAAPYTDRPGYKPTWRPL
jgi:hypothetical protein